MIEHSIRNIYLRERHIAVWSQRGTSVNRSGISAPTWHPLSCVTTYRVTVYRVTPSIVCHYLLCVSLLIVCQYIYTLSKPIVCHLARVTTYWESLYLSCVNVIPVFNYWTKIGKFWCISVGSSFRIGHVSSSLYLYTSLYRILLGFLVFLSHMVSFFPKLKIM